MVVFTIGFAKKSAEQFFGLLRVAEIKRLLDVRLNNTSQLAGFTKRSDLSFFLRELCGAEYLHEPLLTPTQELLDAYKKRGGSWETYENAFNQLLRARHIEERIEKGIFSVPTVLLCSEASADHCHRRLVLEYLGKEWGDLQVVHL